MEYRIDMTVHHTCPSQTTFLLLTVSCNPQLNHCFRPMYALLDGVTDMQQSAETNG